MTGPRSDTVHQPREQIHRAHLATFEHELQPVKDGIFTVRAAQRHTRRHRGLVGQAPEAQRLRDMRDAAQAAIRVLGDRSADELENTEALALAVPHAVEIVGEAASRVSRPFCEAHPEIAWSEVTGMRHRIVHAYFAINYGILWKTVQQSLPALMGFSLRCILTRRKPWWMAFNPSRRRISPG